MYNKPGVARGMDWCRGRGKKPSTASFNPLPFSPCIHVLASSSCLCCATECNTSDRSASMSVQSCTDNTEDCHIKSNLIITTLRNESMKIPQKKHMTSQHKYRCYKLYIGHPHLHSVLKWIFHKFKLSHPHHSTCQRLSEQGRWREETPPSRVFWAAALIAFQSFTYSP